MKRCYLIIFAAVFSAPIADAKGNGHCHGKSEKGGCANSCSAVVATTADSAKLSEAEAQHLLYMREEEKLARDVYLTLGKLYDQRVFVNIPRSEQHHMNAVLGLLESYGLKDPVKPEPGQFTDPKLQDLYDALIARGSTSREEAFLVGALVEEVDIQDLQDATESTENESIRSVLGALVSASERHLNAFVRNYESASGKTYVAQHMPQADVDAMLGR
ncbi:DUF2202 domain-containing protein [Pontiellaceae bacterium B12227]|nr:DUF2202 domain-containing protein [Pontiellaceae bacterium B12227]